MRQILAGFGLLGLGSSGVDRLHRISSPAKTRDFTWSCLTSATSVHLEISTAAQPASVVLGALLVSSTLLLPQARVHMYNQTSQYPHVYIVRHHAGYACCMPTI